jgi:hypothetical protein
MVCDARVHLGMRACVHIAASRHLLVQKRFDSLCRHVGEIRERTGPFQGTSSFIIH